MSTKPEPISAEELDRRFDDGEDMSPYLDMSTIRRPGREVRRVNVDFPVWMVESLDAEANRLGVTRQSIIKSWIAEKLDHRAGQGAGGGRGRLQNPSTPPVE